MEGIGRVCATCGKYFVCTDGDFFCSDACYDAWEEAQEDAED